MQQLVSHRDHMDFCRARAGTTTRKHPSNERAGLSVPSFSTYLGNVLEVLHKRRRSRLQPAIVSGITDEMVWS